MTTQSHTYTQQDALQLPPLTYRTADRNGLYRIAAARGMSHHDALRWAVQCVAPSNTDNTKAQQ